MNNGKKNFNGKRQNKRREINYLIKNNKIIKRNLNLNEIILFYNSIKLNIISNFGIIKLSELKLEIIFKINQIINENNKINDRIDRIDRNEKIERNERNEKNEIKISEKNEINNELKSNEISENIIENNELMTLMKYAIEKKRNKIIGSLIRGGYDPSVYPYIKSTNSFSISNSISSFPLGYSIWLIYQVYEMIEESLAKMTNSNVDVNVNNPQQQDDEGVCQVCLNHHNNNDNDNNDNNDSDFIVDIKDFLLTWKPCYHKVCYECTWKTVCTPLIKSNYSLRCPVCHIRCDGGHDEYYLIDETIITNSSSKYNGLNLNQLLPEERSIHSFNLWFNLPSELDEVHLLKENKKRPEFIIGPIYEVSKYLIGTTKEQRLLEFHRSIVINHIYRLYWIFCCGVNVNGHNQYGQTPLMISIISNNLDSLKFLLWCGADVTITDNIKSNLLSIAYSHKKEKIYTYLIENLPSEIIQSFQNQITMINLLQHSSLHENSNPNIVTLISIDDNNSIAGRGSCYVDNCFSPSFLNYLDECLLNCPVDLNELNELSDYGNYGGNQDNSSMSTKRKEKNCSSRYYIYDSNVIIRQEISKTLEKLRHIYCCNEGKEINSFENSTIKHSLNCKNILPTMKYLQYSSPEISLESHIDLSKEDPYLNITSTHTLIIYLTTCNNGGETTLLNHLNQSTINIPVQPVRGRLLIFPHICPHKGETTIEFPKTLLRCEAY